MTNALNTSYLFGMALVPALIAIGLVLWKLNKSPVKLGGVQITIVVLVAAAVTIATFIGGHAALGGEDPDTLQRWQNPLLIGAALIGFGVGNGLAAMLRKPQTTE